jgi:putative ABC transport system permease protein
VIINDVAAARFFDGRPALGETLNIYGNRTVVGIVGAVRQNGPEAPPPPEAYIPLQQATILVSGDLVIRTTGDPVAALPAIKRAVLAVLPSTAFPAPRTGEQLLETLVAGRRFNMYLFAIFGMLGLVIAVVGVYGVMTHAVQQRTAEFGVRLALGAQPGQILTMVLRRAVLLLGTGLIGGIGIALALSRVVATFLFDVRPGDPVVLGAVATVLAAAGLVAAFVPAFLASKVDPIVALRSS